MVKPVSRRGFLAGAACSLATGAMAEAPLTSMRPVARAAGENAVRQMIMRSGLAGKVGFAIADAATGEIVEAVLPDLAQPPASVTKAFTALYALETLGPTHRFETRLLGTGPVIDGILEGDLILAGGGDPNLVTDQLAELATGLKETGLHEVRGDFLVWDEALTNLAEIDAGQDDYVGYNPTVTGLNLNFNRVHFEWKKEGSDFATTMDARSENFRPAVTSARINIVDRASPVFTYRDVGDVDQWTVARRALNNGGSRWLPVRHPALYCAEVFATFARSHGIVLKRARSIAELPNAHVLTTHQGVPMTQLMRGMLRFSTNITAEAAGLAATAARAGENRGLRTSALGMARWATDRVGGIAPEFVDHSGLGDLSRVTAGDMVRFLLAKDVATTLHPILRTLPLVDDNRQRIPNETALIRAKTGTLNFVTGLAGYLRSAKGREYAFAYFAADLDARERGKLLGSENPPGSRSWNNAARSLQNRILRHWALRAG
ncbi:D-alanyl-D-alanine carboxypeptidase/D-alanyl-D-alanine-endopeptidase [Cognatiyoonia sp. IB215446]|uniref:D-alanyl-D-alanine carboxypeptidase/D-alanyl-D-alanine endopeptidase n=1 Tax=Cognatiyoonia sp. IB215446 TaxID=3097355 RepID=UPI002A0E4356|nr:D-alanyl-D-alanine carboxypeptidase/D-alanyl-D-alanine-endopeptidase [Cognatiyoonia sp. IB215446]MDX8347077.1 D-alanyl-D-alanine carboxypeptidase/D-alanyl-D-alanine-endopeptidase [Cognatiyoonia sp. IB215446]